ncbi:unnamed protein product [Brachionus calyciflorus]|uniref:EamA domain-containing protein n=1 Tax=Brachionus calyciflorus TaxID=104777 RepID=A0A813U9Y6_9BILA|nr:unnamed protein product [Brachionus calyciflorus]
MLNSDKIETKIDNQKVYLSIPTDKIEKENFQESEIEQPCSTLISYLKNIRGYAYGLLFAFSMCMAHILVKMAPSLDAPNHSAVRYVIQLIVMYIFIKRNNLETLGPKSQQKLLILRGVVGSTAVIFGFFSVRYLDVSDLETLTNSAVVITAVLSRIFLNEKLTICHFFSLILTISGVFFIVRPSFLFGIENDMENFLHLNLTHLNNSHKIHNIEIKDHSNRSLNETLIGVSMVLISAVCMSISQVAIRKLCLVKVHFSITSIYPALVGLPSSLLISFLLIETNNSSHNLLTENLSDMFIEIGYSICAGIFGTMGLIFLNNALQYEDATKIGMVKTFSVFFSFFLQYIFLDITVDILGALGAIFIISAILIILAIKMFDKQLTKSKNCLVGFLLKKY